MKIITIIVGFSLFALISCTSNSNSTSTSGSSGGGSDSSVSTVEQGKRNYLYSKETRLYWPTPLKDGEPDTVALNLTQKNYYVVFDGSGSMDSKECGTKDRSREDVAKDVLTQFANQIPTTDNLGLFMFDNDGVREVVPLGSNTREQFISSVQKGQAGSGTPLKTAIGEGIKALGVQARKQLGYGEYHLVVVTDGEASLGEDPSDNVMFTLNYTPIVLHTIGFCIGTDHVLNQKGRTDYKSADSPESLAKGLKSVLAESESFTVDSFKQ